MQEKTATSYRLNLNASRIWQAQFHKLLNNQKLEIARIFFIYKNIIRLEKFQPKTTLAGMV
ncbi:MAG: hypothetical protein ACQ9MH_06420 [Nitrospinales bacterium]